jgi:hypothetical protein
MDEDELESSRAEEGSESASTWTVPSCANCKKLRAPVLLTRRWFALAEQAINTVYALGNLPDVLSDTLIIDKVGMG